MIEANVQGARHYDGPPCPYGHTRRFVSNRKCVTCQAERQRNYLRTENGRNNRKASEQRQRPARAERWRKYSQTPEFKAARVERQKRWLASLPDDHPYKLADKLRVRQRKALRRALTTGSTIRNLGCSAAEFKLYIEAQFDPSMDWSNWGSVWQLDHRKALGLFNLADPQELAEAFHYSNLQPLLIDAHKVKTAEDIRKIKLRWSVS